MPPARQTISPHQQKVREVTTESETCTPFKLCVEIRITIYAEYFLSHPSSRILLVSSSPHVESPTSTAKSWTPIIDPTTSHYLIGTCEFEYDVFMELVRSMRHLALEYNLEWINDLPVKVYK